MIFCLRYYVLIGALFNDLMANRHGFLQFPLIAAVFCREVVLPFALQHLSYGEQGVVGFAMIFVFVK